MIAARGLSAGYREAVIVRDLHLHVGEGEIVALLGPNGAGKSTTVMTLAGALAPLAGEVHFAGREDHSPLHRRTRAGLAVVTERRSVFMQMSTLDNLRVARCDIEAALTLFPELKACLKRKAGLLSGGEQQMLALARNLARSPRVLLADELSLGLAPLIVDRLLAAVRQFADSGGAVLLVEQHISKALSVADRAYVMAGGQLRLTGTADEVRSKVGDIEASYLAQAAQARPGQEEDPPASRSRR